MIGCCATPACEGGPIEIHTTPAINLALAVKRQVVCVFGDSNVGECSLGWQTAFDQPVWRRSLCDACIATAAGIAGADGDDDLRAGGNDIQPFSTILADFHHLGAAAGADFLYRFDHLLDARQMVWQMAKITFGGRASGFAIGIAFDQHIPGGLGLGDSRFQIFESQLTLVGIQLLGPLAIKRVPQFGDQIILAFSLGLQARYPGLHGLKRLAHSGRESIQINGL
jgi:hypothetical protein